MENDPSTCENRTVVSTASPATVVATAPLEKQEQDIGAPVLSSVSRAPSFPASSTLGLDVVNKLARSRYVTSIGILGDPASGKTACLVSLYLLVSNGYLEEWAFADSLSLIGFEDIARGSRQWNGGNPPEQITLHTEMADDRQPGMLHLRLKRKSDSRRVDLTLPDLPGEWTEALVKSSRSDRFEFMKGAETVWLVVDGRALRELTTRQGVITRLGELLGRLEGMTKACPPKVLVVVTHRDKGPLDVKICGRLNTEIAKRSLPAEIIEVASVSDDAAICKSGFGLEALLNASVGVAPDGVPFWPSTEPTPGSRAYLSYRRDR